MPNQNKNNPLLVALQADKNVISADKPGTRILEINLTAKTQSGEKPRIPLNLALVIDRSGSMHGEKLHFVKEAAAHVIDLMRVEDRAAIITYDDKVETLISSQFLTDKVKHEAKGKIRGIRSGGSTFLYGGWLRGCREAAEAISEKSFNRTLLLTDGLANVGERNVGAISMHAQELFTRHISTSCFGVGQDYDEHMLETIANYGGGSFHFLETVTAIPLVFEREFDEIISVALKNVQVAITLPTNVEAEVSASWRAERQGDQLTIFLGSLVEEQTQSLYLQLSNLDGSSDGKLTIPLQVTGVDAAQVKHEVETTLTLTTVTHTEEVAATQDLELMERFGVVDLADKANEALKRERLGDRKGSSQMMRKALNQHEANISNITSEKYELMANEMSVGYDALERKRRHYDAYQSKRGWQSIRDYKLSFATGLPIADIEGKSVLINTASATSIAVVPEWLFMDEVCQFQDDSNGLTCEGLSHELGTQVDVMLGMDILGSLHVRINPAQGVIQFSRRSFRSSGVRIPLRIELVPPRSQLNIDGKDLIMHLVTTLKMNYAPADVTSDLHQVGVATDGLPGKKPFDTPFFKLPITLGHQQLTLNCGVAHDALPIPTGDGVLGADLLQSVPVTLAFPDGELILFI